MKSGTFGATQAAREKIAKGYKSPFVKKKKGCGCNGKGCAADNKTQPVGKSGTETGKNA